MSDTPISDSTPHNVGDLGMLCRRLERELNAANGNVERLTKSNLQLREGCEEQKQRINRLEEAGDAMVSHAKALGMDGTGLVQRWNKAKEAQP